MSRTETQTRTTPLPVEATATEVSKTGPWRVVLLNDPVSLMSYIVLVLKKVLGFNEVAARKHMLEAHEQGRSVVWSGLREQAEHYVFTLQNWHLTVALERNEED